MRRQWRYAHDRISALRLRRLFFCSTAIALVVTAANAQDDTSQPARNNYGSPGLLDMPSARMGPDGELSVGAAFTKNIQRYNLGFQALPWLETSFRYTGLQHFDAQYPVYYDRSFAVKLRLMQESDLFPAISVGVNDVVGTGIYGGEYLVASKQFGAVDATIGMGWGRMGSTALFKNPLAAISSSFKDRSAGYGSTIAGGTNFAVLFHGEDVGLFGGLNWTTPIEGLSLIGEYSSDTYSLEASRGAFSPNSQFNLGASYQVTDTLNVGVSWLYGHSIGANLSFNLDPVHDAYPQRLGPAPSEPRVRTAEEQQAALERLTGANWKGPRGNVQRSAAFAAKNDLADELWRLPKLDDVRFNGHTISIVVVQGRPEAICRAAANMVSRYDTAVKSIKVIHGTASAQCEVPRAPSMVLVSVPSDFSMGATALADISSTPLLIDAAGRSPAGDAAVIARIRADAVKQQITVAAVNLTASEATVYYNNGRYFSEASAIDRLTRILMQDTPADIEKFRLIVVIEGTPIREFDLLRTPIERALSQTSTLDVSANATAGNPPMQNPVLAAAAKAYYPYFSYTIFPQFRQQLFDPQNPFGVQLLAGASATLELLPGLTINAEGEGNIYDNFNVDRPSDSVLPHVRTDFVKYFTEGKNGIGYLDAEYRFRLAPSVYASVRAGYLESMFGGAGGEVLWRPDNQRWAVGADFFEVQQRNFDRLFGLQNYRAFTGHVSLYYASPWYDLDFVVRTGQYLAGDRGFTFEMTRRFSTGVEIGAFFTKTNVSAERFGEGSFDKGIIIRIPLNWIAPVETQSQFNLDLRPVQRDGGQRLEGDTRLFYETRRYSEEDMKRYQDSIGD